MTWNDRYQSAEGYLFGTAPNAFLAREAARFGAGMSVLAVADGEGRNGVFLAERGAEVTAVDASSVALSRAQALAADRGVSLTTQEVDLLTWDWPEAAFDAVVAIFIQFAGPADRPALFDGMKRAVRPGGFLLMEGYRPEQLAYGTGGPPVAENMYTGEMLQEAFGDWDITLLRAYDAEITEGTGHDGMSALIDLIAVKPA